MDSESTIRVLVVDDHQVLADSLVRVLGAEPDIEPVGVAPTLARAMAMVAEHRPDVVLLDHALPDGEGAAAVRPLLDAHPGLYVVMLTASTSDRVLGAAMEAGAAGFISKSSGLRRAVSAVRSAARGDAVVSPRAARPAAEPDATRGAGCRARPHRAGAGDPGSAREGAHQRRHLRAAVPQCPHRAQPHRQPVGEAGCPLQLEALAIAVREGLVEPPG